MIGSQNEGECSGVFCHVTTPQVQVLLLLALDIGSCDLAEHTLGHLPASLLASRSKLSIPLGSSQLVVLSSSTQLTLLSSLRPARSLSFRLSSVNLPSCGPCACLCHH